VAQALYRNSLSLALLGLFVFSFVMHGLGGWKAFNEEALIHGQHTLSLLQFFLRSTFWFQSFQNWQSEFLVVGAVALLGIRLRERGSPESKPVAAPHSQTGTS